MFLLLKRHDLKAIRYKIIFIYGLNVLDIIFTLLLIKTGIFVEGNFFMRGLVNDVVLAVIIKIMFVGLLMVLLYKRIEKANEKQLQISNILLNCCGGVYAAINAFHVFWSILSCILLLYL